MLDVIQMKRCVKGGIIMWLISWSHVPEGSLLSRNVSLSFLAVKVYNQHAECLFLGTHGNAFRIDHVATMATSPLLSEFEQGGDPLL